MSCRLSIRHCRLAEGPDARVCCQDKPKKQGGLLAGLNISADAAYARAVQRRAGRMQARMPLPESAGPCMPFWMRLCQSAAVLQEVRTMSALLAAGCCMSVALQLACARVHRLDATVCCRQWHAT